jgi:hypothetical protein
MGVKISKVKIVVCSVVMWCGVHRGYMWWTVIQLVSDDRVQKSSLTILDHNPPNVPSMYIIRLVETCRWSLCTKITVKKLKFTC